MIVILSHAHPSVSKGGAEVSAYTLYLGLRRLGLPVAFVAMCVENDISRLAFDTADEYAVSFQPEQYDRFFHCAEPAIFEKIEDIVEKLSPTTLIFHHFLYLGINTLRRLRERFRCPSVLVLHEFLAICHHHGQMVSRPAKNLCLASSATRCGNCFPEHGAEEFHARKLTFLDVIAGFDHLVSPSHFLAERFVTWGVDSARISVIENGLAGFDGLAKTDSGFLPRVLKTENTLAPAGLRATERSGRRVFGYFGQINPFKGVDLIIEAARILEDFPDEAKHIVLRIHGNVVGVDDEFKVRFDAACAGGKIEYVGPYDNSEVLRLMAACDYILMASKWWENSPVVIQEAYAVGRPVIAPAIGGLAEKVLDGRSGHHFIFNDAKDLTRVLVDRVTETPGEAVVYVFPRPATAVDMAKSYVNMLNLQTSEFNLIAEEIKC